jgi:hypothetical protein
VLEGAFGSPTSARPCVVPVVGALNVTVAPLPIVALAKVLALPVKIIVTPVPVMITEPPTLKFPLLT